MAKSSDDFIRLRRKVLLPPLAGIAAERSAGTTHGRCRTTVEYEFAGERYTSTLTAPLVLVRDFENGEQLTVYLNPRKPKRCLVLWHLFGRP